MAQKAKKPETLDRSIGYKTRRDMLLRLLPLHSFKVAPAAREAGYSPNYARHKLPGILKKDDYFCCQLERLKAENLGAAEDKLGAADQKLQNIIDRQDVPANTMLKALELFYRRHGALADKQILETAERERELSDTARKEARKLAIHLMNKDQTPDKPPAKAG